MFGHGREVCTFGDSFSSIFFLLSCRAPKPCFLEALGQMFLECKQCCHVFLGASRAVEETVDDNVLTLADLCSDTLKEKHLTTKSARGRKLREDFRKALTSELGAKTVKTENQFARVDGVDTKRLRDTLSKSSQFRIQIVPVATRPNGFLFHFPHFPCYLFGSRVHIGFCCFVAEVLPDHGVQNTVLGRLTQTSKEEAEPSSAWLLWKTGHRAWTEAAPTATTSQLGE